METFLKCLGIGALFIGFGVMWGLIIWAASEFPQFWKSKE